MRKCLAVIFIIIFSFQVLPMKVLGKLLSKAQTEEEVKHSDSNDTDNGALKYNDFIAHYAHDYTSPYILEKTAGFTVHKSDDLPPSYVTEIPSPPPNC